MQSHRISKERSRHRILEVDAGQVVCPRQGIVDVERCWVCPAYGGLSEGRLQGVLCTMNLGDVRIGPQPTIH